MDSILGWMVLAFGTWYGGYRFLLAVAKADEEREARNRAEGDEMW